MGFFDILSPLLNWLTGLFPAAIGDAGELIFWAAVGSVISMFFYKYISPQKRIRVLKQEIGSLRRELLKHDGEIGQMWPGAQRLLALNLKHVGMTLGPALVASLPVLFLLAWISNTYSFGTPAPGAEVEITAHSSKGDTESVVQWEQPWPLAGDPMILRNEAAGIRIETQGPSAVPVIHKKVWWNALFGNPLGYIPADDVVERIELELPPKEILTGLPRWLAGWEAIFFAAVIGFSLALKFAVRIQ